MGGNYGQSPLALRGLKGFSAGRAGKGPETNAALQKASGRGRETWDSEGEAEGQGRHQGGNAKGSPASLGLLGRSDAAASATAAARAAVARSGRTTPARLLSPEDVLLPPLRAAPRCWQSRCWHPHAGQAATGPPGAPGSPAAPPASQWQPCGRDTDHGPPLKRRTGAWGSFWYLKAFWGNFLSPLSPLCSSAEKQQ